MAVKIQTAADVLAVVRARGLGVRINPGPPPMPVLTRPHGVPRKWASPALVAALKEFRTEIIELLKGDLK